MALINYTPHCHLKEEKVVSPPICEIKRRARDLIKTIRQESTQTLTLFHYLTVFAPRTKDTMYSLDSRASGIPFVSNTFCQ